MQPQNKPEYSSSNFQLRKLAEGVYSCIHKVGGKQYAMQASLTME